MYYTYMLRCSDNSIYTGMTNDLEKRLNEHKTKSKNGAKYAHGCCPCASRSSPTGHQDS